MNLTVSKASKGILNMKPSTKDKTWNVHGCVFFFFGSSMGLGLLGSLRDELRMWRPDNEKKKQWRPAARGSSKIGFAWVIHSHVRDDRDTNFNIWCMIIIDYIHLQYVYKCIYIYIYETLYIYTLRVQDQTTNCLLSDPCGSLPGILNSICYC